jgi:hypothetical protein
MILDHVKFGERRENVKTGLSRPKLPMSFIFPS